MRDPPLKNVMTLLCVKREVTHSGHIFLLQGYIEIESEVCCVFLQIKSLKSLAGAITGAAHPNFCARESGVLPLL